MPTPPKESIKGNHAFQIDAFDFSKNSYKYLVSQEALTKTEEFHELDQTERDLITAELKNQTKAYELLWERVDKY